MRNYFNRILVLSILLFFSKGSRAQFLMDMIDTTTEIGKNAYITINNYNHLKISGYMQPQYQVASEKGAHSYAGGDFDPNSDNRFTLRRGRLRFDYVTTDAQQRNQVHFVFQFDGSERGVFIRDFWGRYWENKWNLFAFTTGMFARPFGFEVNLSSSDREAPERGRMSQTLMKTERDIGFMTSLEKRDKAGHWHFFRIDAGFFNGQGLTAPGEFDSYKDFIAQLVIKPQQINKAITAGGGVSILTGGIEQLASYAYRMPETGAGKGFVKDSLTSGAGSKLPRQYYGANAQVKYRSGWGFTELRAEYWRGIQTGNQAFSETPANIGAIASPLYVRPFNGAFFYFLQNIVNRKNQLVVKYDWYDPNTKVGGKAIGSPGTSFTEGDIKYNTLGVGFVRYINPNLKVVIYYDLVTNETTRLAGYTKDRSDNVLTFRTQFRF